MAAKLFVQLGEVLLESHKQNATHSEVGDGKQREGDESDQLDWIEYFGVENLESRELAEARIRIEVKVGDHIDCDKYGCQHVQLPFPVQKVLRLLDLELHQTSLP